MSKQKCKELSKQITKAEKTIEGLKCENESIRKQLSAKKSLVAPEVSFSLS